jgi:hypothetical protein
MERPVARGVEIDAYTAADPSRSAPSKMAPTRRNTERPSKA